jgi:predicted phosphodiesterase
MKLNILSDLHLSVNQLPVPASDADVVILAGDVARPREAVEWARHLSKPTLYVAGNHEFYGGSLDGINSEIERLCFGTNIKFLQMREVVIGRARFLGTTLWTGFDLFEEEETNELSKAKGQELMRDFSRIRLREGEVGMFSPDDCAGLHATEASWLDEKLSRPHDGPTVVITHHAPSKRSINPRFEGSVVNACFVSDCERLMGDARVALWIHGHTHDSFDYIVNGTRVLCNPRGYARGGVNENSKFDPQLIVEI